MLTLTRYRMCGLLLAGLLLASGVSCGPPAPAAIPGAAEINVVDADGMTPLMAAVQARNLPRANKLLAPGADPDAAGGGGQTALMLTWMVPGQAGVDLTKTLAAASKDLDKANVQGQTALMAATGYNRPDIATVLVKAGASVAASDAKGRTPLFYAAAFGQDAALVSLLMKKEAEVRAAGKAVPAANADGLTPLMEAASSGNLPIIAALIAGGADLEARDYRGETAMFYAAGLGHPQAIRALVDAGAAVDAVEGQVGDTVLAYYAGSVGREDVIQALLDAGADPRRKNKGGTSAIDRARLQNQPDKLAMLEKAAATRPVNRGTKH